MGYLDQCTGTRLLDGVRQHCERRESCGRHREWLRPSPSWIPVREWLCTGPGVGAFRPEEA